MDTSRALLLNLKTKLFILCGISAFSVFSFETMLVVWRKAACRRAEVQIEKQARDRFGSQVDHRSKGKVVHDLRKTQNNVWPFVGNDAFLPAGLSVQIKNEYRVIQPLSGIANATTVCCNETGQFLVYQADARGFNNPDELYEKASVDVVLIGDSFAQGFCVPVDKNIAAHIRKNFPLALNFGRGGSGPLMELATLKEYAARYKPHRVIWLFYEGNDLLDLNKEKASSILASYLEPGFRQGLLEEQSGLDQALRNYMAPMLADQKSHQEMAGVFGKRCPDEKIGVVALSILKLWPLRPPPKNPPPDYALFRSVLAEAKQTVESWQGSFYFVNLPTFDRFHGHEKQYAEQHKNVRAILTELGIKEIDVFPVFSSVDSPLDLFQYQQKNHYNEEGYQRISEVLINELNLASNQAK